MSGHAPRPTLRPGERPDSFIRRRDLWLKTPAPTPIKDPPAGGAGGAGPVPFSQTRAGLIFSGQQSRELLTIQSQNAATLARQQQEDDLFLQGREQTFQRQQLDTRIAEERRIKADERARAKAANINQLRVERQGVFSSLMKSGDQARAVIFALGFGPENDVFDVRAQALGTSVKELKGAQALRATTQRALSRVVGRGVTIGREGVRGLGPAVKSARAFVQGGADIQTLLASAFGVGSLREGEQPGISAARLQELFREVTPTGVLR